MTELYAPDKPAACDRCSFYRGKRRGCCLGKENCYYLRRPLERPLSPCIGCPYIRDMACVGVCYKQLRPELWGVQV